MPTTIDISGVAHKTFRARVERHLRGGDHSIAIETGFWSRFLSSETAAPGPSTLVVCDLSTVTLQFKKSDPYHWRTSVRNRHPYFVALLRTQKDRALIDWVDELIRASDVRMEVCSKVHDLSSLTEILLSALRRLDPDHIVDARYSPQEDRFWVQFGDGLSGSWTWTDLRLEFLKESTIPESASPSASGSSLELLQRDGGTYDIDSSVLRAVFDTRYRAHLAGEADKYRTSFGDRLKQARRRVGLTQIQLGEKADLDQAVISRIERGKVRPRIDTLNRIASSLNMTIAALLAGDVQYAVESRS